MNLTLISCFDFGSFNFIFQFVGDHFDEARGVSCLKLQLCTAGASYQTSLLISPRPDSFYLK